MSSETFPRETSRFQVDAPKMYGTHQIENVSFSEYHAAFKYFFASLPKNDLPLCLLDAACGNENRVLDGMKAHGKPILLTAADVIQPKEIGELPSNVMRKFELVDLRNPWPYKDNTFDGVIFTWALHWMGYEGAQNALDSMTRVLKPGAGALLATLTPFDGLIANHVFLRSKMHKYDLQNLFPGSSVSRSRRLGESVWKVQYECDIRQQLNTKKGYAIKNSHPLSILGAHTLIGFTQEYLKKEFERRGLEVIMKVQKRNDDFPNRYSPTLPEGRTQLIYVVRKQR